MYNYGRGTRYPDTAYIGRGISFLTPLIGGVKSTALRGGDVHYIASRVLNK